MREIVPVSAGETYKLRLINGGVHYGLRINVGGLKMRVVAADSEPVEPVIVDEVFLHVAERFDVEITIPQDWAEGDSTWIRADTAESTYQGYQNGIRAILSVVSNDRLTKSSGSEFSIDREVNDPEADIRSPTVRGDNHLTLNCFEREPFRGDSPGGRCLPITTLSHKTPPLFKERRVQNHVDEEAEVLIHVIDSHFQPPPQVSRNIFASNFDLQYLLVICAFHPFQLNMQINIV